MQLGSWGTGMSENRFGTNFYLWPTDRHSPPDDGICVSTLASCGGSDVINHLDFSRTRAQYGVEHMA